ncbi:MAG: hypothetical protein EOP56_19380 [Sphingobacteriales bacterium]|nr:MAG: hypothetical protein EOP56_19380 [Sphingobacteriales bacterium]
MELHVVRQEPRLLRLALAGRAGTGKTYSALLLAYGITGDWGKVALIDTEQRSASLYAHLGPFTTVQIGRPFHPSRFYEAVDLCEDAGKEVIILDSLSSEWAGEGGVREMLDGPGREAALEEHRCFLNLLSDLKAHIICTMRSRQHLIKRVERVATYWEVLESPVQEEGIEYGFTTVLKLDTRQHYHVVKDLSGAFKAEGAEKLAIEHGALLAGWCSRTSAVIPDDLQEKINACRSQEELQLLLVRDDVDMAHIEAFTRKRLELEGLSSPPLNAA